MTNSDLFEFAYVPGWYLQLDELADMALPEIWQQLLTAQSQNWHLLPEDLQALTELGQGLGSSGLSNQQRLLALTEQRLQRLAAEAEERRGRLARLLGGLGWCSGLLLVCLWL